MSSEIAVPDASLNNSKVHPRRRWVKVDVPEDVFDSLHQMAAQSRMRVQPYLRRFLAEAWPYPSPSDNPEALTFSSDCR